MYQTTINTAMLLAGVKPLIDSLVVMNSQTIQEQMNNTQSTKAAEIASAPPKQVLALSAQELITRSGNTNMLEGRSITLNLFMSKKT